MNQIQAVVFDLDGTLLDTLEDLADSVNTALKSCGKPKRTLDEVRRFVGNGIKNLMQQAMGEPADTALFEKCFAAFKQHYAMHCNDKTRPYDGILPLLENLKQANIPMAIVSNKVDSAVKALAEVYFPEWITVAIGECEGISRKPAPDTALAAVRQLGIPPEQSLYVGDSDVDIQTAHNAGMDCVSVTWGFRDRAFLEAHGATRFADSPQQLEKMILQEK